MRRVAVFILIILSASNLNAQSNERIINDMFFDLFGRKDTIFIVSEIRKPTFDYDSKTIEDKTGLKIPDNIILEWRKNKNSDDSTLQWSEFKLNNSYFKNYTFVGDKPYIKCIKSNQIDALQKQKRPVVYAISKIVFDDKKENAIFRHTANGQVLIEESILIKKIFGKWVIISRFDWKIE
ncbi:hypothetical protein [uncultured Draconibacterium sp.]|uniref:hypothetical protein n=1 Tax=uncultured Draconibacterium sp. TaxID=1573823 RepID=UPI002AA8EE42|nr:hypothetical protein [uncultured Draconibacterium sp.]